MVEKPEKRKILIRMEETIHDGAKEMRVGSVHPSINAYIVAAVMEKIKRDRKVKTR